LEIHSVASLAPRSKQDEQKLQRASVGSALPLSRCIMIAKVTGYLIHGRASARVLPLCSFCAITRLIVAAVENIAAKVLHAMKFKFHDYENRTRQAKHFLNVQRAVRFGTWFALHSSNRGEIFLPGGVS
jgi:hypothetical protein